MARPQFAVGIDLGTTNCCLAFALLPKEGESRRVPPVPQVFPLEQLVSPDAVERKALLPSYLYMASEHESPKGRYVGHYAREQGARVPSRLAHSAKSWLSAPGVDRRAAILPWQSSADLDKVSPVSASADFLSHIKKCWNKTQTAPLEEQLIVLTVPASFDAVARELTVEAAKVAGLSKVILIEEPLAAFYAWLSLNRQTWRRRLRHRKLVLVCDVGGGTTDFTLIAIKEREGVLYPERIAVGEHLLAGGDNIDRTLAHIVESRLVGAPGSLDGTRFAALVASCRQAKEELLRRDGPQELPITLQSRGSSLIGSTMSCHLSAKDVQEVVLENFFPSCKAEEVAPLEKRSGLVELGLPYAQDGAVTRNLLRFLRSNSQENQLARPDAILFNGGTFRPQLLRRRVIETLDSWFTNGEKKFSVKDLTADDLDEAVARGASVYALARQGEGVRVGANVGKSYYIGFRAENEQEQTQALCVIPSSADEGSVYDIKEPSFYLLVGRPARFSLYTSSRRHEDSPGQRINLDDSVASLPPLTTVIDAATAEQVPVYLQSRVSEVGTLDLACVAFEGGQPYDLTFELRSADETSPMAQNESAPRLDDRIIKKGKEQISEAFAKRKKGDLQNRKKEPRRLGKALETTTKEKRSKWSLALCRGLWEGFSENSAGRRRSPEHEESWLNLTGYCLRPGFGAAADDWRMEQMRPLLSQGLQNKKIKPVRIAWWIFWRRLAGGLSESEHRELYEHLAPHLLSGRGHQRKGPQPDLQEKAEMWRLAASLERLPPEDKAELGSSILPLLRKPKASGYAVWALSRIGARVPFADCLHYTLPANTVTPWVELLMEKEFLDHPATASALLRLSRRCNERDLDINDKLRREIAALLMGKGWGKERLLPLFEVVDWASQETAEAFGEGLPEGLTLR